MGAYALNEKDAATAIRQMLELGARQSVTGSFSKDAIMTTLFPESIRKTLQTIQQLGLTNEVDRFTATLSVAAEKAATNSIPIFTGAINRMTISDAMRIIKTDGSPATEYLRRTVGSDVRQSVTPVMRDALNEYKLVEQWEKIIKPAQAFTKDKINLDLATLMAGMMSETMFRKIEEKEKQIRADAAARTTPLLKKVFSRKWD
jgi:hypothetical protein